MAHIEDEGLADGPANRALRCVRICVQTQRYGALPGRSHQNSPAV
jgi:hypothetical protein